MQDRKTEFLDCFRNAVRSGTLVRLTLSGYHGGDSTLKKVLVRSITLRVGPRLSFVYRHATRDITKNFTDEEGLARVETLLGEEFQTANLSTTEQSAQLELRDGREPRLVVGKPGHASVPEMKHDHVKKRLIDPRQSPWLHALGVTTAEGRAAKGMEAKFRQINKFIEILQPLLGEAGLNGKDNFTLVDMGCGKGYLTFAAFEFLVRNGRGNANVRGIEARPELVELCNRVAVENRFDGLRFEAGTIERTSLDRADVLVALHACDTATDDAIAKGIQAGASLILVAPCCHKELRPQLRSPPVLADALKHGILRERQAEFITDALRAALLELAGYETKVFEFISTEHTAKNLMIAAAKRRHSKDREELAQRVRELAAFYGIKSQRLAEQLGMSLSQPQVDTDGRG
jgi:SAM-dependent methyltransferase